MTCVAPEYFPSLPFWARLLRGTEICLCDGFQYGRQSLQNRARLRTPDGWQWITVPVKGGQRGRAIREIEIDNTVPWQDKHLRSLQYNYRTSPFFEASEDRFEVFFSKEWNLLGELTIASIELVCDILRIPRLAVVETPDSTADPVPVDVFTQPYRQNFEGFEEGMSVLDAYFNLGYETLQLLK